MRKRRKYSRTFERDARELTFLGKMQDPGSPHPLGIRRPREDARLLYDSSFGPQASERVSSIVNFSGTYSYAKGRNRRLACDLPFRAVPYTSRSLPSRRLLRLDGVAHLGFTDPGEVGHR